MSKKKGKSNDEKKRDDIPQSTPQEDLQEDLPDSLTEELLQEPEILEQLRELWVETQQGDGIEPTQDDLRNMLQAITNLNEIGDDDLSGEELEELVSEDFAFDDLDSATSELATTERYLNVQDDVPGEILPDGYSQAVEMLNLVDDESHKADKLARALDAAKTCPQVTSGWVLASTFTEEDAAGREYLRRAVREAEWFFHASLKHVEFQLELEEEYLSATLDALFHMWRLGMHDEVISTHNVMLERCVIDAQGHQTIYAYRLYEQEMFDRCQALVESIFKNNPISLTALNLLLVMLEYRTNPKSPSTEARIATIVEANEFILDIFLGDSYWQEIFGAHFEVGSEEEAHWIASISGVSVRSTEGFVRWMRNTCEYSPEPTANPESDFRRQLQMLNGLPCEPSTWILESKKLAETTYCTFIYDVNQEELLCVEADEDKPSNARLWDVLVQAMLDGQMHEPSRPSRLLLTRPSLANAWKARCEELEIECEYDVDAVLPDEMLNGLLDVINKVDQDVQLTPENWSKAKELPVLDEVWHVGVFQPPIWISDSATPRKSCVALVIDEETEMIRIHDLAESRPTPDYLARTIMKGMFFPLSENMEPSVPKILKVHPHTMPESVSIFRDQMGLEIQACDVDDEALLDSAVEHLILHCSDVSMRESLFECCELDETELRDFYKATAAFYKAAVWKSVPSDRVIELSFPNNEYDPFYVVIIGQSGFHFGIVCSDDLDQMSSVIGDYDETMESDLTFLNFGESHEIPPIDLWFIEQYDFDVAGTDAYPLIQRFIADQRYRRPTRSELDQIEFAVRALPHFVNRDLNKDFTVADIDSSYGDLTVRMRWASIAQT